MSKNDLTVQELYNALAILIEKGCGDYGVVVSFDSGYAGTSIKNTNPKINKQPMKEYCTVKFEGY